ncbi:hypothetical protein [Embleya hyalina]|uniref:DUF3168 domain-containing protein n=1 Tax=Embleya hyalina TaxID=516124 RepID=A0A401YZ07_9ACTN|nr:hypothetical protein [Embleya hyalina]GCD99859.1 hypothetical protein EHYA_07581 [Embleya hyalina]
MMLDPVALVAGYLTSCSDVPAAAVTGDLLDRQAGQTSIYLRHSGGFRVTRHRMDRADVEYDVYHEHRSEASTLSRVCRDLLLEDLPGRVVNGALVLDVVEISSPQYYPDPTSREHVYGGEVTIFYIES